MTVTPRSGSEEGDDKAPTTLPPPKPRGKAAQKPIVTTVEENSDDEEPSSEDRSDEESLEIEGATSEEIDAAIEDEQRASEKNAEEEITPMPELVTVPLLSTVPTTLRPLTPGEPVQTSVEPRKSVLPDNVVKAFQKLREQKTISLRRPTRNEAQGITRLPQPRTTTDASRYNRIVDGKEALVLLTTDVGLYSPIFWEAVRVQSDVELMHILHRNPSALFSYFKKSLEK
jgi:hypothetical protein